MCPFSLLASAFVVFRSLPSRTFFMPLFTELPRVSVSDDHRDRCATLGMVCSGGYVAGAEVYTLSSCTPLLERGLGGYEETILVLASVALALLVASGVRRTSLSKLPSTVAA